MAAENEVRKSANETDQHGTALTIRTGRRDCDMVAIPAYNEASTIGSVVLAAGKYADSIVVVDDGSTDGTSELASRAGATVLQQGRNRGKGAAVERAFEYARQNDVEELVLLDADWQHNPHEMPKLLEPLHSGDADVVIGSRYIENNGGKTPLYRRVGQVLLDKLTALGIGASVSDSQSGYRAFNRNAVEAIRIQESGFGVETELLESAIDSDLRITEVPITINYDVPDPSTSNPMLHGFSVVDTVLRIVRDRHPLLFFGVPGLTLMTFGLVYGIYTMSMYEAGQGLSVANALYSSVTFLIGILSVYSALIMNMLSNKLNRIE